MERSALYRRALAPISTFAGTLGIAGAAIGAFLKIPAAGPFSLYWMGIAIVSVTGALLIARRQAAKQAESFWSPPTRRVAQAMVPALLIGLAFGVSLAFNDWREREPTGAVLLVAGWALLYGLSLHAASFFVHRGLRLFSWGFLLVGLVTWWSLYFFPDQYLTQMPHLLMGVVFGLSHLAYGIYLYFTERKNEA